VGFVVDVVALGQVFFEYFGFPCQFSFQQIWTHLSSGAGTVDQSGPSLTPPHEEEKTEFNGYYTLIYRSLCIISDGVCVHREAFKRKCFFSELLASV
jgi:hypothetical protein